MSDQLHLWEETMVKSMAKYSDKIVISINQAVAEGFRVIVESNLPNMSRLIKKLVKEKERCELSLRFRSAQMDSLIRQVMSTGGNPGLKQQVSDLLQILRRPALPDIKFVYKAVGRREPSRNTSSNLPINQ